MAKSVITRNAEGITIRFPGERSLGEIAVSALHDELRSVLRDHKPASLWFDLAGVVLLSSEVLGFFVDLHNNGLKVVLLNPSDCVRSVIEAMKLDTLVELIDAA